MKPFEIAKPLGLAAIGILFATSAPAQGLAPTLTYRHFEVEETEGRVTKMTPVPDKSTPQWAKAVSQDVFPWTKNVKVQPFFAKPIPFVLPPSDPSEPFHSHNHQPSITWLANGDLLAIWYSTKSETGTELTVLASRLKAGQNQWEPSSEFFEAPNRNMHGSSIFHDGKGTVFHFNGMGPDGGKGWASLALLLRTSQDNGATWTAPHSVDPRVIGRHQVIADTLMTKAGVLLQNCDAVPGGNGGTALHISRDGGKTWPVRKLLTPGSGEFDGGGHTGRFTATSTRAEHAGYLAATQSPDGVIHLISSRLHYRFNLAWLTSGMKQINLEKEFNR